MNSSDANMRMNTNYTNIGKFVRDLLFVPVIRGIRMQFAISLRPSGLVAQLEE